MIVIDQSGSVSAENFVKEKNFAAGLVDNLLEDDPRAQIGIVAFGGKSCVKMGTGQLDAYSCRKLTDAYSRDSSFNGGLSDCKERCLAAYKCAAYNYREGGHYRECALFNTRTTEPSDYSSARDCDYFETLPDCTPTTVDLVQKLSAVGASTTRDAIRKIDQPFNAYTPTADAIFLAQQQFLQNRRNGVALDMYVISDGIPNSPLPGDDSKKAREAAAAAKTSNITIISIGVGITKDSATEVLRDIASNPKEVYAYPSIPSFDELEKRVFEFSKLACHDIHRITPECGEDGTLIDIFGENFYDTKKVGCKFTSTLDSSKSVTAAATRISSSQMQCTAESLVKGQYYLEVTIDGYSFTNDNKVFTVTGANEPCPVAVAEGMIDSPSSTDVVSSGLSSQAQDFWWLGLLIPLLLLCCLVPLLFYLCRKKESSEQKAEAVSTDEVDIETPAEVAPSSAEPEAYAPKPGKKHKWEVVGSSYIGFGKGKMNVDWNGHAPESAPHEQTRKMVSPSASRRSISQMLFGYGDETHDTAAYGADDDDTEKSRSCWSRLCCVGANKPAKRAANAATSLQMPPHVNQTPTVEAPAAATAASAASDDKPSVPNLPVGWEELKTEEGDVYFENREKQLTQWERPSTSQLQPTT